MRATHSHHTTTAPALVLLLVCLIGNVKTQFPSQYGGCPNPPSTSGVTADMIKASQGFQDAVLKASALFMEQTYTLGAVGISAGIVYDQELIWSGGYGYSNMSSGAVPDVDTVFRIGSISKVFTTIAMMTQRDAGLFHLDTQVTDIIPEFKLNSDPFPSTRDITMRQLATHMAGLPSATESTEFNITDSTAWADIASNVDPILPTDVLPLYSNLGFSILGQTVATAANQTFTDLVDKTVITPLNLTSTGVEMKISFADRVAQPYNPDLTPCNASTCLTSFGWYEPAGSLYSSVKDLGSVMSLFFRDDVIANSSTQILDGSTIREIFLPRYLSNDFQSGFAMPFELYAVGNDGGANSGGYMAHTKRGDVNGYSSFMFMINELKLGLVVLTNVMELAPPLMEPFADIIVPAFDAAVRSASRSVFPLPSNAQDVAGTFQGAPFFGAPYNMTANVRLLDYVLFLDVGEIVAQLQWVSGNTYKLMPSPGYTGSCFQVEISQTFYNYVVFTNVGQSVCSFSMVGITGPGIVFEGSACGVNPG